MKTNKESCCDGKTKFKSPSDIRPTIARLRQVGDKNIRSYKCSYCGFWHLGHFRNRG